MKINLKKITLKAVSIIASVLLMISGIPVSTIAVEQSAPVDTRVVDPSTMDDWKNYFGEEVTNTENVGGIWTDKSVFKDASEFPGVSMTDPDNNFLVALSAISSNKSITGYSHIPTDTVLVLDVSGSMNSSNNDAVDELVESANNAITKLQELNKNNRVGVVMYSGNYTYNSTADDGDAVTLLPIDRYTHADNTFLVKDSNTIRVSGSYVNTETVKVNSNVSGKENGIINSNYEKDVYGGTYIQAGIYKAMEEFLNVDETTITDDAFQNGTTRMPVMVLMSDGVPTIATNNYMGKNGGVGTSVFGDGSETTLNDSEYLSSAIPFVAQLSASHAKHAIEEKYGRDSLFYTLGFKLDDSPVLNPANSSNAILQHWNTYNSTYNGTTSSTMQLAIGERWVQTGWFSGYYQTVYTSIEKSNYDVNMDYVTEYFNDDSLTTAFDKIVEQITLQSLYYPTYVENSDNTLGGYIEFHDDIGEYTEVKDIKGIMIGDSLYTGEALAENFSGGSLGTIESPSDLGNNLIWAIKERLGITDTPTAQKLVQDAYADGQLSYNAETGEFSNYIGWYADADGNYMGFADKDDTAPMDGAEYHNKSYGFLGEVIDGHKKSDMMYVSVQVHHKLSTDTIGVLFRIPASLIPVISYNISLTGESLENPGDITLEYDNMVGVDTNSDGIADTQREVSPIRLVYEMGLREDINELTVADIVSDDYKHVENGEYTFYSNSWDVTTLDTDNHFHTVNTVVDYEPSKENERYYYTEDSIIYVKNGDSYVPYTGASAPVYAEDTYFRAYNVFELYDDVSGGNARIHTHYQPISAISLDDAKSEDENPSSTTQWYIPKGTVYRALEDFPIIKSENSTGTVPYVHYPDIQLIDGEHYYCENIQGNNGLIKLKAAQGIKISKEIDDTLKGTDYTYTFVVKDDSYQSGDISDTYRLIILDTEGNEKSAQNVQFTDGTLELELKAGEEAYLLDLEAGKTYTVSEKDTPNKNYMVKSVNDVDGKQTAEINVTSGVVSNADFVNTVTPPDTDGALVLYKKVEHPFDPNYIKNLPEDKQPVFKFDVTIGDAQSVEYTLSAEQAITIDHIPIGTEVTIVEDMTGLDGFTSNYENNTHSFIMTTNEYHVVTFTNTYSPEPVSPNITVTGDKSFTGRENNEWLDSDEFIFRLEKWENNTWVEMGTDIATKSDPTFDFTNLMTNEVYSTTGRYSYRIVEVYDQNPYLGITYDKGVRWFDVIVADNDMDGHYEISSVEGFQGAEVTTTGNTHNVHSVFNNTYASTGSDAVTIVINKSIFDTSVDDQSNSLKSNEGYLFGLYQGDQLVDAFPPTVGGSGEAMLTLNFGAHDIGKNISYTLKEIVPDTPENGVVYSDKEYIVKVFVEDDTQGGVNAQVAVYENYDGEAISIGEQVEVDYTNKYDPTDASITLGGTKELVGRQIKDGEFTFELYSYTDEQTTPQLLATTTNSGTSFAFDTISYDKVGTYNYLIAEKAGDDEDITYDKTVYAVNVVVSDVDGVLVAKAYDENNAEISGVKFVNTFTYEFAIVKVDRFDQDKTLAGAKFGLYSDAECTQELATGITGDNGEVTFSGYTAGTYYVKELAAPEGYLIDSDPITIELSYITEGNTITPSIKVGEKIYEKLVVENTRIDIPTSGRICNNIIYVVSGALIVFAGIIALLVTRKKNY